MYTLPCWSADHWPEADSQGPYGAPGILTLWQLTKGDSMEEIDLMHYPRKRKAPTVNETINRLTFIKTQMEEDLKAVRELKTEFPVNRQLWDSLNTIIHLYEVAIVELDISLGEYKENYGKE